MTEYTFNNIEWEITSACNAACPQCPRNYFGGATWKNLPVVQVDLDWTQKHFTGEFIRRINKIDFCGTYGDPIMNNYLPQIITYIKSHNPTIQIQIKTNGGIRSLDWWKNLAEILGDRDSVVFAIDGLEDTNHLYRRNVLYTDVMDRARAFIDAGGTAYWSFIVFKHNEHQIDTARERSCEYGFRDIIIKKTWRFMNKNHQFQSTYPVFTASGVQEYELELPVNEKYVNENYKTIAWLGTKYGSIKNYFQSTSINCHNKSIQKIYISSEGLVFPCGWIHDRLYGYEAEQHSDHSVLLDMINSSGGFEQINLNNRDIDQIIDSEFWHKLQNSWHNNARLERCGMICGSEQNGIGAQNAWNPIARKQT